MNLKHLHKTILVCLIISHSSKAQDYQLPYDQTQKNTPAASYARSVFSSGIGDYLKNTFNAPGYVQDFLPNNFFHFTELLQHGNQTGKNKTYFKSVMRLFSNKIKAASYLNAYAFGDLLAQLPNLLEVPFAVNKERAFESLKDVIYELQYQHFKANFPLFKSSPETFLEALSQEIEDASELRKLTMIFFEITLHKLIWSPEDNIETWFNVKRIADQLTHLHQKTIILDRDDLNSLFITLLERYCMFLDIAGSSMPITTFERIKEDIATHHINFLELEEQEELIETKMQRFTRCLAEIEAKARAYTQGMII